MSITDSPVPINLLKRVCEVLKTTVFKFENFNSCRSAIGVQSATSIKNIRHVNKRKDSQIYSIEIEISILTLFRFEFNE